jgi:glyoxylase-like metal-dependent hydrolase (beta-lactamase superfamily II)
MASPGHDRGCLTYRVGEYLFTGDSYIPGVKVIMNFPQSNKQDAEISLERIFEIKGKYNVIICPGH